MSKSRCNKPKQDKPNLKHFYVNRGAYFYRHESGIKMIPYMKKKGAA